MTTPGSSLKALARTSLLEKLQEIKQDLAKSGLHVVLDLRRDYFNAWHELKSTGATNITITSDRLPYFAQSPALGPVTMLAKVTNDPAMYAVGVDGVNVALNFTAAWGLNLNDVSGPALDTPIALTIAQADLAALKELSLVLKVDFA